MAVLLYFDFLGILLSFLVHHCLLLGLYLPSGRIAIVLNIGICIAFSSRLIITKNLRQRNSWFFDKNLKNICPSWLKSIMGLIIIYGIVFGVFYLVGFFSELFVQMEDTTIVLRKLHVGIFALTMVCYALEFLLIYTYKILARRQFSSDGVC